MKNNEKGITLIALIITVIILVILAAVSIRAVYNMGIVGHAVNGTQQYAKRAKEENAMLDETGGIIESALGKLDEINIQDEIQRAWNKVQAEGNEKNWDNSTKANALNTELLKEDGNASATWNTTNSVIDVTYKGYETTINPDTGTMTELAKVSIGSNENGANGTTDNEVLTPVANIENYLKVGDYVAYDPLHTDLAGTQAVEASKLTYTSPTGTGQSHGNGYTSSETGGGQTFTAKSGINWRVLSISPEIVELISDEPITKDDISHNGGNFVLNGAIGYLYAEQELHEICKIYGYGYGAYKGQSTTYTIGGPAEGEETTGTITGSGARSMIIQDINKIENITSFTDLNSNYGNTTNPTTDIYYPTTSTITGKSTQAGVKNLINNYYNYTITDTTDYEIEETSDNILVTNDGYFLASRMMTWYYGKEQFYLSGVTGWDVSPYSSICNSDSTKLNDYEFDSRRVRPCIAIKSNTINIDNHDSDTGKKETPWQLK